MIYFGPIAKAAHGGHGSPSFDLTVGFVLLVLTWVTYIRKEEREKANIWTAIGISAICAVFIFLGINELLH